MTDLEFLCYALPSKVTDKNESIGSINAVYFEIEVEDATLCADALGRMASSTATAVRFATEFR